MKSFITEMDLLLLQDVDNGSAGGVRFLEAIESETPRLAFASSPAWEGLPGSRKDMDGDITSLGEGLAFFLFEVLMTTSSPGLGFNSLSSAFVTVSMSRCEAWKIHAVSVC
jgi:hypothetical protein